MGIVADSLERAGQQEFTRPIPKSAGAQIRNLVKQENPEAAREMAEPLADMLAILGEDVRRRDVLDWTEAVPVG